MCVVFCLSLMDNFPYWCGWLSVWYPYLRQKINVANVQSHSSSHSHYKMWNTQRQQEFHKPHNDRTTETETICSAQILAHSNDTIINNVVCRQYRGHPRWGVQRWCAHIIKLAHFKLRKYTASGLKERPNCRSARAIKIIYDLPLSNI